MKNSFLRSVGIGEQECRENSMSRGLRHFPRALAHSRQALILTVVLSLFAPLGAFAQIGAVRPRVTDRVNLSQLTVVTGSTHSLARAQFDRGVAPPDLPMNRIMLILKRSPEQESALQDLLVQQQTASSANFHKWLTPDQFGQQFGPADADIQAVTSWLASFGFQSVKVSRGRTIIEFSGTASQVESALHTPIHQYVVNGESHWANANDPQIPAALAPVIAGFVSLHNFPKKPTSIRSGQMATVSNASSGKPQVTFQDGSHGVGPADFKTIYNIAPTMNGNGVTIGVVARSNIIFQDVLDFRSVFNLGGNDLNIILNGPDPTDLGSGEEVEAVLDASWPGAVAPAAQVDLVVSESTNAAAGEDLSEFYIVDNNVSDIMTESFSVCEGAFGNQLPAAANFYSSIAEQAAAQGITYLVSSGDGGPDSCDDPSNFPSTPTPASVNLLASTPYTVAVGGTQFNDVASPGTYWNATNSPTNLGSAKSYIPENAWNESCTVAQCGADLAGPWSSGGGQSAIFPKPVWQTGVTGIPVANSRFVPDVSVTAANHDGYSLCLDASCQNHNNPSFNIISGTSASVQAFGGIMALVVQQQLGRVGIADMTLYKLAATQQALATSCNGSNTTTLPAGTCTFNDVTAGNTNLAQGETGFTAGTGYDEATGLGSVNVTNLVNNWHTAITNGSTTALTLNGGTPIVNVPHGTSIPVSVSVTATTGTPTGDVSLVATSLSGQGADFFPLTNGTASWSTVFLPGGTYTVKAHYEGDPTFLGSDSPSVNVSIAAEGSQTSLGIVVNTPCTLASSVAYGSPYILSVAVADLHSAPTPCIPNEFGAFPSGGVSLTDTVNGATTPLDGGNFTLNSVGYFEDQPIQLPVGIHTIKATYVGDNSFTGSNSTAIITVTQAGTTTSLGANPTTASAGQSVTLTATVATQSNATASASQEPTGTVQFFLAGAALGSPVAVTGSAASSGFAQAIATMTTSTLAGGSNVITAKYLGDNNYAASATSPAVTVTVGSSGINVSPGCSSSTILISTPGQSGTCTITVTGANGFSGAVTLTCGVSNAPPGASDPPSCAIGAPGTQFTAPNIITLSGANETGSATLTVSTTAASTVFVNPSSRPQNPNWFLLAEVGGVMASIFLLSIASRKRRGTLLLGMALCAVILVGTSCSGGNSGGGGGGGSTNPGTTIGSYTITVTATPAGGTAQPTPITINVQ